MVQKTSVFRAMHEQPGAFIIPNPWDTGSARMLAALGFRALATTSAGMAFSMGMTDGQVSMQATLDHCRMLVLATPLPVSADLERGFGDSPEEVARTIGAAAEVGLAGCSIEDHTGRRDDPIFAFEHAVERIAAAAEAARALPGDFVLTARCENFLWNRPDLDETIRRLHAFEKAGADVLYAPGLKSLDAIREVCSAVSRPVNMLMGMPGTTFSVADLTAIGVKRISVGGALAKVAYGAFVTAAREMADAGTFGFVDRAIPTPELETLLNGPRAR